MQQDAMALAWSSCRARSPNFIWPHWLDKSSVQAKHVQPVPVRGTDGEPPPYHREQIAARGSAVAARIVPGDLITTPLGLGRSGTWISMQVTTRLKSAETARIAAAIAKTTPKTTPKTMSKTMPPRSAADWKPQPCGLSREELRRIVRKILG